VPYTDFGARQYNTALRRWMTPDPLSEKYYGISPYAFCNNSPMVFVDPDGEDSWEINRKGVITYKNDKDDSNEYRLYSLDSDNNRTQQYVSVKDRELLDAFVDKKGLSSFSTAKNINDIFKVFLFAADNTDVEWVIHRSADNIYTLGTIHEDSRAGNWSNYNISYPISSVHSHPNVSESIKEESISMGLDWEVVKVDYETYSDRSRLNYIYFPKSKRLYYLGRNGYSIIRTIDNDYKRFYFGTLNHR